MTNITLVEAIYNVASALQKDNGQSDDQLAAVAGFDLIKEADPTDYKGIMFHSEGSRKFSAGWYVRKNPRWQDVWLERFGENEPDIANALTATLLPVRQHDPKTVLGNLSSKSTPEILDLLAYAQLENRRYSNLDSDHADLVGAMWGNLLRLMLREVEYRAWWLHKAERLKLDKDKKVVQAQYDGVQSYATVHREFVVEVNDKLIFEDRYTSTFTDMYVDAAYVDPTLGNVRPLPLPERVPVAHMSQTEMIHAFLNFITQAYENRDYDEFRFDDALLAVKREAKAIAESSNLQYFRREQYWEEFRVRLARQTGQHTSANHLSEENS